MDKALIAIKNIQSDNNVKELLELSVSENKQQAYAIMSAMVKDSYKLQECTPMSIASAVVDSISLNLSPQSGEIYIIPYGKKATVQVGYKGLIQMGLRSEKIKKLHARVVYDGQWLGEDFLTGDHTFQTKKKSNRIIGYMSHLETIYGFSKTLFWTAEKMHNHFCKFSKNNYDERKRLWMENKNKGIISTKLTVEEKGKITMLKQILNKWAPKTTEINRALDLDGKEYQENGAAVHVEKEEYEVKIKKIADKILVKESLNAIGNALKNTKRVSDKNAALKIVNQWAKEVGINFSETGGWYGVTDDDLTAVCFKAEQELGVEIIVNDVRISQRVTSTEEEREIDV